jgi:hypothetical protein
MATSKAANFVKQAISDKQFRSECALYDTKQELLNAFDFSENDFENAINMQLVKCQTNERAEYFQQIRLWFNLL